MLKHLHSTCRYCTVLYINVDPHRRERCISDAATNILIEITPSLFSSAAAMTIHCIENYNSTHLYSFGLIYIIFFIHNLRSHYLSFDSDIQYDFIKLSTLFVYSSIVNFFEKIFSCIPTWTGT